MRPKRFTPTHRNKAHASVRKTYTSGNYRKIAPRYTIEKRWHTQELNAGQSSENGHYLLVRHVVVWNIAVFLVDEREVVANSYTSSMIGNFEISCLFFFNNFENLCLREFKILQILPLQSSQRLPNQFSILELRKVHVTM